MTTRKTTKARKSKPRKKTGAGWAAFWGLLGRLAQMWQQARAATTSSTCGPTPGSRTGTTKPAIGRGAAGAATPRRDGPRSQPGSPCDQWDTDRSADGRWGGERDLRWARGSQEGRPFTGSRSRADAPPTPDAFRPWDDEDRTSLSAEHTPVEGLDSGVDPTTLVHTPRQDSGDLVAESTGERDDLGADVGAEAGDLGGAGGSTGGEAA